MRQLQIIPQEDFNLYGALVGREVELHRKGRAKWAHQKHPGWVKLARGMGGVVLAEIRTKADPDQEWQLFQAFLGFLDRNFRENLAAINIQFSE